MSLKNANYPLDVNEDKFQVETGQPKGFKIDSQKMPTITLIEKQSGKIGNTSPISPAKYMPESSQDTFGIEENFHNQYVKENEFEHSEGVNNKDHKKATFQNVFNGNKEQLFGVYKKK